MTPRGSFIEPHTDREVPLGTLEVRNYLQHCGAKKTQLGRLKEEPFPTYGPENRYKAILFVEKEGFDPLLRAAQIAERFDIAIMSTKGMSVTAARQLLDQLSSRVEQILVLHDFDVSGFTILGTLASDSRRYRFRDKSIRVIDIGLQLADVEALDLQSEPVSVSGSWAKRVHTLQKHGATDQEIAFLRTQRVELNAMTSRQFVDHPEAKLAEHGVSKVIPEEKVLESHARYLLEVLIANQELEKILPEVRKRAAAHQLPANLRKLVANQFEKTPAWAWDRAVVDLVKRLPPPRLRRKKAS
jgi:hypothetical protein